MGEKEPRIEQPGDKPKIDEALAKKLYLRFQSALVAEEPIFLFDTHYGRTGTFIDLDGQTKWIGKESYFETGRHFLNQIGHEPNHASTAARILPENDIFVKYMDNTTHPDIKIERTIYDDQFKDYTTYYAIGPKVT